MSIDTETHVLRASGRAWAAAVVHLERPVLVAGAARIAAEPTGLLVAAPDGPRWSAEFRVPGPVASAAQGWGVEVTRLGASEPAAAPLQAVEALAARVVALGALVAQARAADDERLSRHEAARHTAERQLGAATAERDRALLELDGVRGERAGARRQADELRAELARVEDRWKAATGEVRELRAKLRVSSVDRAHLVELLEAATAERDALRERAKGLESPEADRRDGPAEPPSRPGWFGRRSRSPRS